MGKCQQWSSVYKMSWGNESNLSDFSRSNSVGHMRIPKVVTFKVVFTEKLKSLFRSSEGYLEPGRRYGAFSS